MAEKKDSIARNIREARRKLDWNQGKLAKKLHVTTQTVSRWENAETLPQKDALEKLSSVLGVSFELLSQPASGIELPILDAVDIVSGAAGSDNTVIFPPQLLGHKDLVSAVLKEDAFVWISTGDYLSSAGIFEGSACVVHPCTGYIPIGTPCLVADLKAKRPGLLLLKRAENGKFLSSRGDEETVVKPTDYRLLGNVVAVMVFKPQDKPDDSFPRASIGNKSIWSKSIYNHLENLTVKILDKKVEYNEGVIVDAELRLASSLSKDGPLSIIQVSIPWDVLSGCKKLEPYSRLEDFGNFANVEAIEHHGCLGRKEKIPGITPVCGQFELDTEIMRAVMREFLENPDNHPERMRAKHALLEEKPSEKEPEPFL